MDKYVIDAVKLVDGLRVKCSLIITTEVQPNGSKKIAFVEEVK